MRRSVSRIRPLQLAQRGLQVLALAFELLDVLERLRVFGLGERVDRAELLAPALQAFDAREQAPSRSLISERGFGRARAASPSFARRVRASSPLGFLRLVARLLGSDLRAGDLLAAQLPARACTRDSSACALAQLGREPFGRGAVCGQLGLERLDPGGDRRPGGRQRG